MANAYWAEYINGEGIAVLQQLVARSKSWAFGAFASIEECVDADPAGTVEIRLTLNGRTIASAHRECRHGSAVGDCRYCDDERAANA